MTTQRVLIIFVFLFLVSTSYAQNNNDCYFLYAFGQGTLRQKMSIWKTEGKKIWKHGNATEIPAPNDSNKIWLDLYEVSLSDMWQLGLTTISYEDQGLYTNQNQQPGEGVPTEDNSITQFNVGWWNNPNSGGVTTRSSEAGSRLHSTIKNGLSDNVMLHEEVDIQMNVDNVGNNWSWGLPSGMDRKTAIRHELAHSYGVVHAAPGHAGAPLMKTCAVGQPQFCNLLGQEWFPWSDDCIDRAVDCVYDIGSSCFSPQLNWETPTPVYFSNAAAFLRNNQVMVQWETAQEIGWLGFDILRSEKGTLNFQKINPETIETIGDELTGARYEFLDQTANPKQRYSYLIRIHTLDGFIEEEPFFYEVGSNN